MSKPLINEMQKLSITGSGISEDGFPWVSLSNGYKFYGFLPSTEDKLYRFAPYRLLDKKIKDKLIKDAFGVAIDIVMRYVYPQAQPDKTPPYGIFTRKMCPYFHYHHANTIQNTPSASADLKKKLIKLFTLKEKDIVVDAGPYLGYGALKMGELVGNSGKIIAIEAGPDCGKLLEKNIKENSLKNIQIVHKAVWNKKEIKIFHRSSKQANSLVQDLIKKTETNTVQVRADTIDNILNDYGITNISMISLTINGAELEALEGMSKTLENYSPRLSIAGWYQRSGQLIWKGAMALLKKKGYKTLKSRDGKVFAWKEN